MNGTISGPIVVLGATGTVGRGVVQAALARGHAVVAVARDASRLQALRKQYRDADLRTLPGSVTGDAEGSALAAELRRLDRPLAGVVATLCGRAGRGRLLDRPADFLRRRLDEDLLPHLAAARHLLPVLAGHRRGGSYVLVGGPGSEYPWAAYGHRSIGAAALQMLARVLHDEARAMQVRVQLLSVDTPVCTDANRAHACPDWPSPLAVGQRALALVEQRDHARTHPVVRYCPRDTQSLTSTKLDVEDSRPALAARATNDECLTAQSLRQMRALIDSLCHRLPSPSAGSAPDVQSRNPTP